MSAAQTHAVLLRGINLGPRNRVPMAELRDRLAAAGFDGARTYLQSGNVVLKTELGEAELRAQIEELIEREFGLSVPVVTRTGDELADVVRHDPLKVVVTDPKRYQVTFLDRQLAPETVNALEADAAPTEQVVARGREVYAWHPDGVARSKLWTRLAGRNLGGVVATSRNWTTVTALLDMTRTP